MTISEVAADCGLSLLDAQLAKLGQYDEPFRLLGAGPTVRSRFLKALKRRGVRVVSGGRYDHATGDIDKGKAVAVLRTLFADRAGRVVMVGLGDGLNDMSMLTCAASPLNGSTCSSPRCWTRDSTTWRRTTFATSSTAQSPTTWCTR